MWQALAFLALVGGVWLHFWWRKRWREASREKAQREEEIASLREEQRKTAVQSEAQQQALFNSIAEGVLVLDIEGRIQLANQALKRLMRVSHEIRGQSVLEAFRLHQLTEVIRRISEDGPVLGFELELPGTGRRYLQVNAAPILDAERKQQGSVLVLHDLTRLKQLESTRKEFVANVSHELRTPLSLIKGYVETLIDGAKDDPVVAGRFLQTILKHTDRLTFLIEDLLTISQLESGQGALNIQPVELQPITERVLEDFQSRAGEKRTTIKNAIPLGLAVRADSDRLQQVLFNLVDNAIKYGHAGRQITVSARVLDNEKAEICVQDDGPGIPADALGRVFERFYRVERGRSRELGGTGLGLSIVKHIVQCHGGEVWAQSELGQGSSFYFTLALASS